MQDLTGPADPTTRLTELGAILDDVSEQVLGVSAASLVLRRGAAASECTVPLVVPQS